MGDASAAEPWLEGGLRLEMEPLGEKISEAKEGCGDDWPLLATVILVSLQSSQRDLGRNLMYKTWSWKAVAMGR